MSELIIKYKRRAILHSLIFGIIWLVFGLVGLFLGQTAHWFDYGTLVLSTLYFALYYYQTTRQYGCIINDQLIVHRLPLRSKRINLKEVVQVRQFAGDYIFKTTNDEVVIDSNVVDAGSLRQLEAVITQYGLPMEGN